ncbi:MAG TPA: OmpA family protein [Pyrinomonadaceae bacterium]|nr:OmpA family protein [Pyrinomonadaceae bacterium]
MKEIKMILATAGLAVTFHAAGLAQALGVRGQPQYLEGSSTPIYTITVVERTAKAINYQHRGGATKIDFQGTPLMPSARGEAKVESKKGYIEIEVEFDDMQSATRFGSEYLTYVMWAITPEGRATNLGEMILSGTKSKLNVTTEFQSFGLIVTAEPYYAVAQPSNVVVMENILRKDTVGKIVEIEAKYELLERGQYVANVFPGDLQPLNLDKNTPLDLYEARNAVRIAKWAGADVSAAGSFQKAATLLAQAESYKTKKAGAKPIAMAAREAVQTAEDARLIARKRQAEERLEAERAASIDREAQANLATDRAQAETDIAEKGRMAAEQQGRLESERRARAEAEAAAAKELAARTSMEADLAAQRAAREKQAAQSAADQDRFAAADQAEREKQELRNKLVTQLNLILKTRDSARGLIVNMSDVLFDTGKYSLRAGAREKLAKLSGIILAYPTLDLQVEGHTDNVGTDENNMQLSENRARAVRDYLIQEGINGSSISAKGFGEGQAVASNGTSAGRQENRRVELIVSGDVIGTEMAVTTGTLLQR